MDIRLMDSYCSSGSPPLHYTRDWILFEIEPKEGEGGNLNDRALAVLYVLVYTDTYVRYQLWSVLERDI